MNDELMELDRPEDFDDVVYDQMLEDTAEGKGKFAYWLPRVLALCGVLAACLFMGLVFVGVLVFLVFFGM
jgi:hypothetical protein